MGTTETVAPVKLSQSDVVAEEPRSATRAVRLGLRLIQEPLVHFLVLGALLFLYSHWRGDSGPGSSRIVITSGEVEHLASGFSRMWQRSPTEAELKGLIDDYVKEEIATREAMAMGLDRNDTIIRRRLRQKMEFLADDSLSTNPPADKDLQAWMDRHPGVFAGEPQIAFQQVFVNASARGPAATTEAGRILTTLIKGGPHVSINQLGDASLLPSEQPLAPLSDVNHVFGADFADRVMKLEPGQWTGPVESSYGLHLVRVVKKVPAVAPTLDEIRQEVEREVLQERRKEQLDVLYQSLLKKYLVTIELPKEEPSAQGTTKAGARP